MPHLPAIASPLFRAAAGACGGAAQRVAARGAAAQPAPQPRDRRALGVGGPCEDAECVCLPWLPACTWQRSWCTAAVRWAACWVLGADRPAVIYPRTLASCTWAQPRVTPPCIHPPARAHTPPAPQHHHGVKRKESETIQVQHETQGANKKPRVVWSVEMHQQVGRATAHSFGQHVGRSLVHAKHACRGGCVLKVNPTPSSLVFACLLHRRPQRESDGLFPVQPLLLNPC